MLAVDLSTIVVVYKLGVHCHGLMVCVK